MEKIKSKTNRESRIKVRGKESNGFRKGHENPKNSQSRVFSKFR
jgi:hypothetical protein